MENLQSIPFIGVVEDVEDPLKLGRVRVRVINYHDQDIPTEDLDWATVAHPTTSMGVQGAGSSPTWLIKGTTVLGFYIDGAARNVPIVTGVLGSIPNNDNALHSVNKLARGEREQQGDLVGPEPEQNGASQYPLNRTISTPSGHTIELDDTDGFQRIHIRHASGAYILMTDTGEIVIKSTNTMYDVADGDRRTHTEGDAKEDVTGNLSITVDGKFSLTAKGACDVVSSGVVTIKGSKVKIN